MYITHDYEQMVACDNCNEKAAYYYFVKWDTTTNTGLCEYCNDDILKSLKENS